MVSHLSLIYQVAIVGIGIAATVVCFQRSARSGREDHAAFVFFWTVFTGELIVSLAKAYVVTNITDPPPQTLLLLQAISFDGNLLIAATVLRYLHRLGNVRGRQIRDAAVSGALLVSVVALGVPWGVEFDAANLMVSFRIGYWIAEGYYIAGLLYAVILSWIFFVRRPRSEAPVFLIVMALFATAGLLESSISLAGSIARPAAALNTASIIFSSIPYAIYGVFLIVNGGVEESPRPARLMRFTPQTGEAEEAFNPAEPEDPSVAIRSAMDRLGFSNREREVVALILEGHSNQEIANRLYVSLATVKTHIYRIYRKAAVPSRFALIRSFAHSA